MIKFFKKAIQFLKDCKIRLNEEGLFGFVRSLFSALALLIKNRKGTSVMANLASFKFFDVDSTSTISSTFANPGRGSGITLEVKDAGGANFDLKVEGKSDLLDLSNWHDISVIAMDGFEVLSNITEQGMYIVGIEGLSKIRITNSGTPGGFKVLGVMTGE